MRNLMLIGLAAMVAGCGATKKYNCDGETVYVQKDCDSSYETEVETQTRSVSLAIDSLKDSIGVGIGGSVQEEITQLSEKYNQLTTLYLKQMVALCKARQNDPCGISAREVMDIELKLSKQFADAQLGITTATETISNAMADDEAAIASAKDSLGEVEALFEEISSTVSEIGADGSE